MFGALQKLLLNFTGIRYLLRDEFSDTLATGSVNGTLATPGPGTRTVTDTESKLAINGENASFSGGKASPAAGDPMFRYANAVSRNAGRFGIFQYNGGTSGKFLHGIGFANVSTLESGIERFTNSTFFRSIGGGTPQVYTWAANAVAVCVVLRSAGCYLLINNNNAGWRLLWIATNGATETLSPIVSNYNDIATFSHIRIPDILWLPVPLASDGFASAFGTTDGLGHAETTDLGSGGSGLIWTNQIGTFGTAGGRAQGATLSSGIAIATVPTSTADVLVTAKLSSTAMLPGVVVRWIDSSNYVYARHDQVLGQATLRKVVAGVDSQVLAPTTATYSANAELRLICDGTKFRLFYNNAAIGSEQTISDSALQTGVAHGIYTNDVAGLATFDDFTVYACGAGGEYSILDKF